MFVFERGRMVKYIEDYLIVYKEFWEFLLRDCMILDELKDYLK